MKKIIMASALLLAAAGCSTTASNPSSTPSPSVAATVKPAATPLESANQMAGTSKSLTDLIKAHKDTEIKDQAEKLEPIWSSFEDGIKSKYPEMYVKIEKYLGPLLAGANQASLDYEALDRFNKDLTAALTELATVLQSGK